MDNENGKTELKEFERRVTDEKFVTLDNRFKDHDIRLKSSEKVITDWKAERRLLMSIIGILNTFISIVVIGIFMQMSSINTKMGDHNTSQAKQMATLEGKINNTTNQLAALKENIDTKILGLNDKVNIMKTLNEIKQKIK